MRTTGTLDTSCEKSLALVSLSSVRYYKRESFSLTTTDNDGSNDGGGDGAGNGRDGGGDGDGGGVPADRVAGIETRRWKTDIDRPADTRYVNEWSSSNDRSTVPSGVSFPAW
uniref:Uncharacterized protein n=1 Tax=Vespula pensylvanica TaxID=30213 RepID=A0A834JU39_VESPE|nr:hypothetical protein H0235_017026 [Vespula pensylvanica]